MNHRQRILSLAVAVLGLVALACTCGLPSSRRAESPLPPYRSRKRPPNGCKPSSIGPPRRPRSTGQYKVTLTESEVTSYLAAQIQQQQKQGETIPLTNPQIKFTQGQAWVYGTFESGSPRSMGWSSHRLWSKTASLPSKSCARILGRCRCRAAP